MINTQNSYYIYKHTFKNGTVYIGKGSRGRAYSFHRPKKSHWFRVFEKYGEPLIEILNNNLTEQESFKIEVKTIQEYKNNNIKLCNMTNGGEGQSGVRLSDETKQKISDKTKGEKHHFFGKHHKQSSKDKMSKARKGIYVGLLCPSYGIKRSDEFKANMSKIKKGVMSGEKHHFYGKHHSEEAKKIISAKKSGENHQNFGKPLSKETRKRIAIATNSRNSSGMRGVSFDKSRDKWVSNLKFDGVYHRLGRFEKLEDAINARLDAENKYLN